MNASIQKQELLEAIDFLIKKRSQEYAPKNSVEGRILKDNNNGTYEVKINEDTTTIKSMDNKVFKVNDIVKIIIFNNDFNDKQIMCKR